MTKKKRSSLSKILCGLNGCLPSSSRSKNKSSKNSKQTSSVNDVPSIDKTPKTLESEKKKLRFDTTKLIPRVPFKTAWENIKNTRRRVSRADSISSVASNTGSASNKSKSFPGILGSQSEILYLRNMKSIQKNLPFRNKASYWYKIYSTSIDGLNLERFYSIVSEEADSVLLIETTKGEIFGAYMTESWRSNSRGSYYGTGESFIFKFCNNELVHLDEDTGMDEIRRLCTETLEGKDEEYGDEMTIKRMCTTDVFDDNEDEEKFGDDVSFCAEEKELIDKQQAIRFIQMNQLNFEIFKWSTKNDAFMISSQNYLAIGKGDGENKGFALYIDENFEGQSRISDTFNNQPLVNDSTGSFSIRRLEVFGFTSCKKNQKLLRTLNRFKDFEIERSMTEQVLQKPQLKVDSVAVEDGESTVRYDYNNTVQGANAKEMLQQFRLECDHFHRQLKSEKTEPKRSLSSSNLQTMFTPQED